MTVDVSATDATYHRDDASTSIDALISAWSAAAAYKSSTGAVLGGTVVAGVLVMMVRPWLLLLVLMAGGALTWWANAIAQRKRRVAVLYRLDDAAASGMTSINKGIGWLKSSRRIWCVTHQERIERPANTMSVSRAGAAASHSGVPHVLTNIDVASLYAGGRTLFFLPEVLVIREQSASILAVPYPSVRVGFETTQFSEAEIAPDDSRRVGQAWLYANKNGSPDRRRANNRQIPVLEYAQVTLTWPRSGIMLLASNVIAARHFANAVQEMINVRTPKRVSDTPEAPMIAHPRREPTAPSDLERVLQASLDRKRRIDQLYREAVARIESQRADSSAAASANWIAQGGNTTVRGHEVGDFVYVGTQLCGLEGGGVEPALINPELPIDLLSPNTTGAGMTYWPSYSSISAASRTAFLQWLAGGRKDPNTYIGYVFIFFYGLERRVYEFLQNRGSSADEVVAIAREVARLLDLYASKNGSFASYGTAFLDLVAYIEPRARNIQRDEVPGYGVSQQLKITLGELAVAGKPIPAEHALEWVRSSRTLNTPATRCAPEFELLFHIRYANTFGEGMVVKPNKSTIDLTYRPASAALPSLSMKQRALPDVTLLSRPLDRLTAIAVECTNALDAFSRFLGKNPNGRESLAAIGLLPDDLIEATPSPDAASLASLVRSRLDDSGRAHLAAGELLQFVRLAKPDKVTKNEAILLAQILEKLGYGIEPDIRLGGPVYDIDGRVVVFRRLPDCPSAASDEYTIATLLVRLAAMVTAADDAVSQSEREFLERHIEERLHLGGGERQRLAAHLAWLLESDIGMTGLKKRIDSVPRHARQTIGTLLIDVAATDGHVDAREMKILEKLYELLDLDTTDLYRDVHAAHAADEPLAVHEPAQAPKGFAIPPKLEPKPAGIDMDRVRLKIAETRQVSTLLAGIFAEEEAPVAVAPAIAQADTIGTLDTTHSEFLRRLAERETWARDEVERLAGELSLMLDGALETINDYAYATADEPLWEDEDPVTINSKVAMELIA